MTIRHWILTGTLGAMLCSTLSVALPVAAETPGLHPYYTHAMSDLQAADRLLQITDSGPVWRDERKTQHQVQLAINDVRNASIADDKSNEYQPPPDTSERPGRLREINRLLHSAINDIQQVEENGGAMGWRQRALNHVNQALMDHQQAMNDAHVQYGD